MSFDSVFGSGRGHVNSMPDAEECLWDKREHKHGQKLVAQLAVEINSSSPERAVSILNQTVSKYTSVPAHADYAQWTLDNTLPAQVLDTLAARHTLSMESLTRRLWTVCLGTKQDSSYQSAVDSVHMAMRHVIARDMLGDAVQGHLNDATTKPLSSEVQRYLFAENVGRGLHSQQKHIMKRMGFSDHRLVVPFRGPRGWRMLPDDWKMLAAKWWTWQGNDEHETLAELVESFIETHMRRTNVASIFSSPFTSKEYQFSRQVEAKRHKALQDQQKIHERLMTLNMEEKELLHQKMELVEKIEHFDVEMHICAITAQKAPDASTRKHFLEEEATYKQWISDLNEQLDKLDDEYDLKEAVIKSLNKQYERLPLTAPRSLTVPR